MELSISVAPTPKLSFLQISALTNGTGSFATTYNTVGAYTLTAADTHAELSATAPVFVNGIIPGDDLYTVDENHILSAGVEDAPAGVLDNDMDTRPGETVSVTKINNDASLVGQPFTLVSGAVLTAQSDGSFIYVPADNMTGPDAFTYTVSDGTTSATATVRIYVSAGPLAADYTYYLETNQAISASAGVGLLTYDFAPLGTTLDVNKVNNNANDVGHTVILASGADLTVRSDGSFVYVSAPNAPGSDSFSYTISDGTQDDTATVTLDILAPGAAANALPPINFVNSSGLSYAKKQALNPETGAWTSLPQADNEGNQALVYVNSQFTPSQVPVGIVAGAIRPSVVYPLNGFRDNRLPIVKVVSTLASTSFGTTLYSTLDNFTFDDGQGLITNVAQVRYDVFIAMGWLRSEDTEDLETVPDEVGRWFAGPDYTPSITETNAIMSTVLAVFGSVAGGLDGTQTYVDDPTETHYYGTSPIRGNPNTDHITIGVPYHSGTSMDQYGTIIHELTHFYGGTVDNGYFNNPGALEGSPIQWVDDDGEPLPNPLTTSQLLHNADSYAGFLAQYFYNLDL